MTNWVKAAKVAPKIDTTHRDAVPELPEVLQTESGGFTVPNIPVIPVTVEGFVTTQEVPAVHSTSRNVSVTNVDTDAQELVGADPRRKSLMIWTETQGIYLCETRQGVIGVTPYGAHLAVGGILTIRHQNPIWIRGDNAAATVVSYVLEQWAD